MKVLESNCDPQSDFYKENYEAMAKVNEELDKITKQTLDVDEKNRKLAQSRDKKLPRERINALLDYGSPFLELSQLAGYK